jgi:hypothetical protein
MFWTENISTLFQPVLIPTDYMTFDEKLNTLTRLIIFVCIIIGLILRDARILLFMIILVLLLVIVYTYQHRFTIQTDNFLNKNNLEIIDNSICVKPSKNNPFMNPNLLHNNDDVPACPISNELINEKADSLFDSGMYRNADDIYDTTTSKRQFYTVPGSTIPNDQTSFANWLYNRGPTCKENNGFKCYTNLYRDLRV